MEEVPTRMSNIKEEHRDNLLGGLAIILIGILLSSSAIWGLVDNVYSMNSGLAPIMFIILGVGSIIWGVLIFIHKPEA
ncbi:MAG: hypothetical protein ABSC20_01010 [Candidatus Bathyarchaeia archaeon]|jgi:hypothetical protein